MFHRLRQHHQEWLLPVFTAPTERGQVSMKDRTRGNSSGQVTHSFPAARKSFKSVPALPWTSILYVLRGGVEIDVMIYLLLVRQSIHPEVMGCSVL